MMSPMSAEATVVRNYIDWLICLPWGEYTTDRNDIKLAEEVLEEDHYGLEEVKERILEYLAVRTLTDNSKGPDPLLRGTSGRRQDLAREVDRQVAQQEIRPLLPGRRERRGRDPRSPPYLRRRSSGQDHSVPEESRVLESGLLARRSRQDEHGFPRRPKLGAARSAGPRAERTFGDHYLEVDYDLSKVMFVLTANSLHTIPKPLLDRMEVITITGYTEVEKFEIVRKYLISKQMEAHGLKDRGHRDYGRQQSTC